MKLLQKRKIRYIVLALLLLVLFLGTSFCYQYQGFSHMMLNQLLHATMDENKNLNFMIMYWLEFMEKLSFDPSKKVYNFDHTAEQYNVEGHVSDFDKGKLVYHQGHFLQAITLIERDIQQLGETESKLFWLAFSYLRHAETENCLAKLVSDAHAAHTPSMHQHYGHHDHARMCTLPLTAFHDRPQASKKAGALFEKLLETYDDTNRLYQWLLNFSYMTIDGFPQDVPQKYRIQSPFIDAFYGAEAQKIQEQYQFLEFEDRAKALQVDTNNTGRGVAVEDFDKDGYLDIVTGGSFHMVKYYEVIEEF